MLPSSPLVTQGAPQGRLIGRRVSAAAALALAAVLAQDGARAQRVPEIRALWVVRTSLTSPSSVDDMVAAAKSAGFNTLLVQVRGRADAYYNGGMEPRAALLDGSRKFDPLGTTLARAHAAGLGVHAWVNVNLVAGSTEMAASRDHVARRHPEWLMVPRPLATQLVRLNVRSPDYIGRLSRYIGERSEEVEGLYLSPIPPTSADYTVDVIRDIVSRYPIDGVHLDYIRYPSEDFDYSRAALDAFRASLRDDLQDVERRRYDARLAAEPLIYTQAFPVRWRAFRQDRLTRLVTRIRTTVKQLRPAAVVSAAVIPDPAESIERRLQDWRGWLDAGLLDVVCPMAYTPDPALFSAQIARVRETVGPARVWAGIGAFRLTPAQTAHNVRQARNIGVAGVALFSYDSLIETARGPGFLIEVGRSAFRQ